MPKPITGAHKPIGLSGARYVDQILDHAGILPTKVLATKLGISRSYLVQICTAHDISLRLDPEHTRQHRPRPDPFLAIASQPPSGSRYA